MCVDMCEGAFANTTGEFEWVAAGVLTELRAIVITLEAKFDMMALDRQFDLVNDAVAAKLAPLEAQASALAAEHTGKLAALQDLKAARDAQEAQRQLLGTDLSASGSERKSTWAKASAPLRIELTTLGTTIAFVVGMVVANLAHLRQGRVGGSKAVPAFVPRADEASALASSPVSRQYGAFQ